jgi:biotin synthase
LLRHAAGDLGYEVGSGVMIGIPGQSYDDLARRPGMFRRLDLDMIGVGPFLVHPETPLGRSPAVSARLRPPGEQVPGNELMTYKVIALARLTCPKANIPSTTALATLNRRNGRELGLVRGANVIMPNLTPPKYRVHYEIYPNKACIQETAGGCFHRLRGNPHREPRPHAGQRPGRLAGLARAGPLSLRERVRVRGGGNGLAIAECDAT